MDALGSAAVPCVPTDPRILPLIEAHLTLMYASSPACSVHAMDASALEDAGAEFVAVFDGFIGDFTFWYGGDICRIDFYIAGEMFVYKEL